MNLGIYQPDGVVNDLAPHDLSILMYWLGEPVSMVSASGSTVFQNGVPETAFLTLSFEQGPTANVQLSWLAPHKVRQTIVVGSKRMVVYDDAAIDGAVRIYDRGVDFTEPTNFGEYQLTYRSGDMLVPRLEPAEPLGLELADFAHAIETGTDAALARAARRRDRARPRGGPRVAGVVGPPGRGRRARRGARDRRRHGHRHPRLHARAVRARARGRPARPLREAA